VEAIEQDARQSMDLKWKPLESILTTRRRIKSKILHPKHNYGWQREGEGQYCLSA
jgi:hypothetical protein